jgi:putative colanic acid biosynthesis UDP-glucose lipid carrier transferase
LVVNAPHEHVPNPAAAELESVPESAIPSTLSPTALRLTGERGNSLPPPAERVVIEALTDVLLGAGYADRRFGRRERRTLDRILEQLLGVEALPAWLEQQVTSFRPETFQLEASCIVLRGLSREQRRHVLESVRAICDADNTYALEEEQFMDRLVTALNLERTEYEDLIVKPSGNVGGVSKRIFDVVFASAVILLLWPVFVALAIGVKLSSPGPVIFKQRRFGQGGREVQVWKFRSMTVTEDGPNVPQAERNDARVTRFGDFMRRHSLDELPQFFNVLQGDMSVVGPRPHAVAHNLEYRTQILEYMLRHKVKPGLTGWAQVNGWRGRTDTLEKMAQRVAHDLEYIRRQSLLFDIWIIWLTIFGKRVRKNAY